MAARRVAAIVVPVGLLLATTTFSGNASPRLYALAVTEACLESLPHAIAGLPPSTPPVPPALFVYSFQPSRFPPGAHGQLGTWDATKGGAKYEGILLSFFETAPDARRLRNSQTWFWLYGGRVVRNVVVGWDQNRAPTRSLQTAVLGCLRVEPAAGGRPAPSRSTPHASLATFAGRWGGHTRGLSITRSGRGFESANDGCCEHVYEMTFQILSLGGTLTRASAAYRVRSFKRYKPYVSELHPGQVGRLLLRNGIVTNTLARDFFCSDPAWDATGACGA